MSESSYQKRERWSLKKGGGFLWQKGGVEWDRTKRALSWVRLKKNSASNSALSALYPNLRGMLQRPALTLIKTFFEARALFTRRFLRGLRLYQMQSISQLKPTTQYDKNARYARRVNYKEVAAKSPAQRLIDSLEDSSGHRSYVVELEASTFLSKIPPL